LTEPFLKDLMPTFNMSETKKTGATFVQTTPASLFYWRISYFMLISQDL